MNRRVVGAGFVVFLGGGFLLGAPWFLLAGEVTEAPVHVAVGSHDGRLAEPPHQVLPEADAPLEGVRSKPVDVVPRFIALVEATGYGGHVIVETNERTYTSGSPHGGMRFVPASTFKIPHSVILLETNAMGPDPVFLWDGHEHRRSALNQNHDLTSAFEVSCYWCYRESARRIGPEGMGEWLERLAYGNQDMGGLADGFWLQGDLRISPIEQIAMLWRLHRGSLGASAATTEQVLGLMVREDSEGWILRGKTGWALPSDDPTRTFDGHVGWFVGSITSPGGGQAMFASLLLGDPAAVASAGTSHFIDARIQLARDALTAVGACAGCTDSPI